MLPEIAERLLVILRDKHYKQDSFIKYGPILSLQNKYGDTVICVIDDDDINIVNDRVDAINLATLRDRLATPISDRVNQIREPTTFDKRRSGHVIKLIVGLIQEYGALTVSEIKHLLNVINLPCDIKQIDSYLLCAEAVDWVKKDKKGVRTYYFALPMPIDAATLVLKDSAPTKNKTRRRKEIRDHWRATDPDRYRGIVRWMGGAQ